MKDDAFKEANAQVLGVSTDSKHSHKAWIKGELGKLNHPLVADFNKTIAATTTASSRAAWLSARRSSSTARDRGQRPVQR
jgi:alkyl hydroperoxide reductase subunit AhpC